VSVTLLCGCADVAALLQLHGPFDVAIVKLTEAIAEHSQEAKKTLLVCFFFFFI